MATTDDYVIDSDGSLVAYPNPYKGITDAQIQRAEELYREVMAQAATVEVGYLRMARALSDFKKEKLYLVYNFTNFKQWAQSPMLVGIGYRTAQRLVQIADEALPILAEADLLNKVPPISVMAEALPILNDENGKEKFVEAIQAIDGLAAGDAKDAIKEIRGIAEPLDTARPTVFKASVERGETYHRVKIWRDDGQDYFDCTPYGPLLIPTKDWPRWSERFSEHFINYTN